MKPKTLLTLLCVLGVGIAIGVAGQYYYSTLAPAASAASSDGHGHLHGEGGSAQVTVWSERFEIFLEHPLIAVNEPTEFVTHVTDLVTLEPRRQGPVTFILRYGSQTPIEHVDPKPARDGIYIPALTFSKAGDWNVSLKIPLAGRDYVVGLGPVKVYASQAQIDHAPAAAEIEGMSFLKEQQWKIPSKTEPVRMRQTAGGPSVAVPESAIVDEGADKVAFVQLAGETFEERVLELGTRADGFVQVLSGLSEGDRVVTRGVQAVAEAQHQAGSHQLESSDQVISLAQDDVERYAIEVGTAGPGQVDVHVSLPGQIVINTDRVAHIMPNAAGVVRHVLKNVGDTVKAGEVIAWLESAELGKAKVDYLSKWAELSCCSIDLTRAQRIHDSTIGLLERLKSSPSLETIRAVSGEALDANHTMLISSYAELVLAGSAYEREKSLFEKKISSEKDYLAAENELKKADAKYAATSDSIAFDVKRNLMQAQRDLQVRQIGLKGAERNLYVLGLIAKDIKDIEFFAQGQKPAGHEEACDDQNCEECAAKGAAQMAAELSTQDEKLAWYPLRAPFDATVIEKHITLGEKLSDESSAFTIADLTTVWVDLSVFQKDLPLVKQGQPVTVSVGPADGKVTGKISYVGPIVGERTRTALARVVLANSTGVFRPGLFVTAKVAIDSVEADVIVPKDAVQTLDGKKCVFIKDEHGFEPSFVNLGQSNTGFVQVTSGLDPGQQYVIKGAFELKAKIVTSTLDSHAGHGH
ncbi:MAG: efflux RND transporter periplasmic adaptor subunit [Phycisphaerae bacterium]|nr:efflux RND transporter periplasmic adaptor subunit [Phycisphaerae bacterium]